MHANYKQHIIETPIFSVGEKDALEKVALHDSHQWW